jgi:drug/metabolite transporter (DMT)-like permease
VNPAVAVLLGVLVLDERFTVVTAIGFVLVLAGSVLATARTTPADTEDDPRSAAATTPAVGTG